jgi:hypothetical protein
MYTQFKINLILIASYTSFKGKSSTKNYANDIYDKLRVKEVFSNAYNKESTKDQVLSDVLPLVVLVKSVGLRVNTQKQTYSSVQTCSFYLDLLVCIDKNFKSFSSLVKILYKSGHVTYYTDILVHQVISLLHGSN